jgi:hypothetical protein
MIPGGIVVIWAAIGLLCWQWYHRDDVATIFTNAETARESLLRGIFKPVGVAVFFVLPFIASTIFARGHQSFAPPSDTDFTVIASDAFDVRIPGQPDNIGLVWFNPSGNGRHHSMKVCMKYRGVELEATRECGDVFTDGRRWMREFYLQDGQLVCSYQAYIWRTFRPRSSPGVHLIFVANSDQMSAGDFNQSCLELAARLDLKKVAAL